MWQLITLLPTSEYNKIKFLNSLKRWQILIILFSINASKCSPKNANSKRLPWSNYRTQLILRQEHSISMSAWCLFSNRAQISRWILQPKHFCCDWRKPNSEIRANSERLLIKSIRFYSIWKMYKHDEIKM